MTSAVVIQVRMGSLRLPGKVLREIAGKAVLEWVVSRVARAAKGTTSIVVATSTSPADDPVVRSVTRPPAQAGEVPAQGMLARSGALLYVLSAHRGSEHNVLGRFYDAVRFSHPDAIVRITADCPLVDPRTIDAALEAFEQGGCDYLSNAHPARVEPSGFDVEVFSYDALVRAHFEARGASDREHVTPIMYSAAADIGRILDGGLYEGGGFRCATLRINRDLDWPVENGSLPHLSIDTEEDLERVRVILERLVAAGKGETFTTRDVLEAL